jgi:hypothetical protein
MKKHTGVQPTRTFRSRLLTFGCLTLVLAPLIYLVGGICLFLLVLVLGGADDGDRSPITGLFLNLYAFFPR